MSSGLDWDVPDAEPGLWEMSCTYAIEKKKNTHTHTMSRKLPMCCFQCETSAGDVNVDLTLHGQQLLEPHVPRSGPTPLVAQD